MLIEQRHAFDQIGKDELLTGLAAKTGAKLVRAAQHLLGDIEFPRAHAAGQQCRLQALFALAHVFEVAPGLVLAAAATQGVIDDVQ